MSYYTVKQIAEDLGVSEETVRRWLRSKQLAGEDLGPKVGWRVSSDVYQAFKARYRGIAGTMVGATIGSAILPGIGSVLGGIMGAILGGVMDKQELGKALEIREMEIRLREAELQTLKAQIHAKEAELAQRCQEVETLRKVHNR